MSSIKVCPSSEIYGIAYRNFGPNLPGVGDDPSVPESKRSRLSRVLQKKSPLQDLGSMIDSSRVDFGDLPSVEEPVDEIDKLPDDCAAFLERERSLIGKFRNMARVFL